MFRCVSSLERLTHVHIQTHRLGLRTDVAAKYKVKLAEFGKNKKTKQAFY